jgi:hypothetical protein
VQTVPYEATEEPEITYAGSNAQRGNFILSAPSRGNDLGHVLNLGNSAGNWSHDSEIKHFIDYQTGAA